MFSNSTGVTITEKQFDAMKHSVIDMDEGGTTYSVASNGVVIESLRLFHDHVCGGFILIMLEAL